MLESNVLGQLAVADKPCPVCALPHYPRKTCWRCGKALAKAECRICANCDLDVVRQQKQLEKIERNDKATRRIESARLPKNVRVGVTTLDTYETPDEERRRALSAVREWIRWSRSDKPFLFITGVPGTGKSHLAAAALRDWILTNERSGLFVRAFDMMVEMRSAENEKATLDMLKSVPALVLDDIGTENVSDYTTNVWYSLLSHRGPDQEHLPTIITSNLKLEELAARWTVKSPVEEPEEIKSQRVVRRIADYGRWVELTKVYKQ